MIENIEPQTTSTIKMGRHVIACRNDTWKRGPRPARPVPTVAGVAGSIAAALPACGWSGVMPSVDHGVRSHLEGLVVTLVAGEIAEATARDFVDTLAHSGELRTQVGDGVTVLGRDRAGRAHFQLLKTSSVVLASKSAAL